MKNAIKRIQIRTKSSTSLRISIQAATDTAGCCSAHCAKRMTSTSPIHGIGVRIWSVRKIPAQSIMRRSLVFPTSNRIKRSKTCCREPIKMMSGSVSIQIRKSRLEMVHKMRPSIRGRQAAVRASVAQTGRLGCPFSNQTRNWTMGGVQPETF